MKKIASDIKLVFHSSIGIYFGRRAKHTSKPRGAQFKILECFYNRQYEHLIRAISLSFHTTLSDLCRWQRKDTVVAVCAMKTCRGKRRITPLVLNLVNSWTWVVSVTPRPLYPWEGTPPTGFPSIGGCVVPRADLDGLGTSKIFRPFPDSNLGSSSL